MNTSDVALTSDISYEPPDNTPTENLRAIERKAIEDIVAEFETDDMSEWLADPPAEEEEVSHIEETPEEATSEPQEDAEDKDPGIARGVERLVARELKAKEREEAAAKAEANIIAKVKELQTLQAEVESYKGLKSTKEVFERLSYDPLGVFKDAGYAPDDIIKLAMAQALGDEAPPALKELTRSASSKRDNDGVNRRIAELEAKLAEKDRAAAAHTYFNQVSDGAREYLKSVGDSTPTIAAAYKADPNYVHAEIMEEIVRDSQARAASDPDGDPMPYAEAVKRVEARYAKFKALMVRNENDAAPTQGKKPVTPTPPQTKPAAKPLYPWQKKTQSLEDEGLREAMREFARVEAANKRK